jgi:hypothetical protein
MQPHVSVLFRTVVAVAVVRAPFADDCELRLAINPMHRLLSVSDDFFIVCECLCACFQQLCLCLWVSVSANPCVRLTCDLSMYMIRWASISVSLYLFIVWFSAFEHIPAVPHMMHLSFDIYFLFLGLPHRAPRLLCSTQSPHLGRINFFIFWRFFLCFLAPQTEQNILANWRSIFAQNCATQPGATRTRFLFYFFVCLPWTHHSALDLQ